MNLEADLAQSYIRSAFEQMLATARRAGDAEVNTRPFGDGTNAIAALIIHCEGVCEFWLGHVALGRPSTRDRDAEFRATASLAELDTRVCAARDRAYADLDALADHGGSANELRAVLIGDGSDDSIVLHVIEELSQHLGHIEITADALGAQEP